MFEGVLNTTVFKLFLVMFCVYHNKYLTGYFEFLHGSRIINLSSFKYFRKNNISLKSLKRRRLIITFIFANTIQYAHTLENNIYHLNKPEPPPFFHSDINPILGHVLVHSIDKTHVLVVIVKFIWFRFMLFLDIVSSNFVPTPNKSFRFNFNKTEVKTGILKCLLK